MQGDVDGAEGYRGEGISDGLVRGGYHHRGLYAAGPAVDLRKRGIRGNDGIQRAGDRRAQLSILTRAGDGSKRTQQASECD